MSFSPIVTTDHVGIEDKPLDCRAEGPEIDRRQVPLRFLLKIFFEIGEKTSAMSSDHSQKMGKIGYEYGLIGAASQRQRRNLGTKNVAYVSATKPLMMRSITKKKEKALNFNVLV